jgi:hypothetical protein
VALAHVHGKCHVLPRHMRVVGQQPRTRRTPEAVQYVGAPPLDEVANLEGAGAGLAATVFRIGVDLHARLPEDRMDQTLGSVRRPYTVESACLSVATGFSEDGDGIASMRNWGLRAPCSQRSGRPARSSACTTSPCNT